MSAGTAARLESASSSNPLHTTLLELVEAVGDVTESEQEVVVAVLQMLQSGRVCLSGSFRNVPVDSFF